MKGEDAGEQLFPYFITQSKVLFFCDIQFISTEVIIILPINGVHARDQTECKEGSKREWE